jgi:predicted cupin superfamily sugar epimerase
MHRLQSDEIWHFYKGSPISIVELLPENGGFRETLLGPDLLQYTVIANTWFGSYPVGSNASSESEAPPYSFVGCTVSPGFEFEDFELASRSKLTVEFPNAAKIIEKLTVGLS